jgi:gliding motility-associated lipoprotein GldH
MDRKVFLILGIFIFYFTACRFNSIYEESYDIPKAIWSKNKPVSFSVPATDTLAGFNLVFSLRNNNDYPFQYLHLFVDTYSPEGKKLRDTVSIKLAEDNGKWLGSGISGIWENEIYFKKNIRFPRSGQYRVDVYQAMRDDNLEGILDFGLIVEKSKMR